MKMPSFIKDNLESWRIKVLFNGGLRNTLIPINWYPIDSFYYDHIRPIFAPCHSDLRAAIPRTWKDINHCMEDFLYACVISFVEKEKGLEQWRAQDVENESFKQADMLEEVYNWAKTGRKATWDSFFAALPACEQVLESFYPYTLTKSTYDKARLIEREAISAETRYLTWIITNRDKFWS